MTGKTDDPLQGNVHEQHQGRAKAAFEKTDLALEPLARVEEKQRKKTMVEKEKAQPTPPRPSWHQSVDNAEYQKRLHQEYLDHLPAPQQLKQDKEARQRSVIKEFAEYARQVQQHSLDQDKGIER